MSFLPNLNVVALLQKSAGTQNHLLNPGSFIVGDWVLGEPPRSPAGSLQVV